VLAQPAARRRQLAQIATREVLLNLTIAQSAAAFDSIFVRAGGGGNRLALARAVREITSQSAGIVFDLSRSMLAAVNPLERQSGLQDLCGGTRTGASEWWRVPGRRSYRVR
jgi:hypothetical protein